MTDVLLQRCFVVEAHCKINVVLLDLMSWTNLEYTTEIIIMTESSKVGYIISSVANYKQINITLL